MGTRKSFKEEGREAMAKEKQGRRDKVGGVNLSPAMKLGDEVKKAVERKRF